MTMVVADPDPDWLKERSQWGIDRWDEVWDGVLHVPPTPNTPHQNFEFELHCALRPIVASLGLRSFQQVAVIDPEKGLKNYRTPDIVVATAEDISRRGAEGHAELVVEVLSPNDESRQKFRFYAARGIPENWIVHPESREIEVYVLRGNTYVAVLPQRDGTISAPRLGLELRIVDGPKLRITSPDGSVDV